MQTHLNFTGLILLIFLVFTANSTLSASETYRSKGDTLRYLKLTHLKTGDTIIIKTGAFVKITYEKKTYKGNIDSISEHSFFMDGKEFELQKLDFILINHRYNKLITIIDVLLWVNLGWGVVGIIFNLPIFSPVIFLVIAAVIDVLLLIIKFHEKNLKKRWKIISVVR